MPSPTITVSQDPTGALVSSPSSISTTGPLSIDNSAAVTIYFIYTTSSSWPSGQTGTPVASGASASASVTFDGNMLFSTASGGPSLTTTTVTRTTG
ncbi:hypothetical protein G6O69_23595 [Pseudenhygromyxa sp. WMMC2535]|uniref:hypothetical protein n=1 Tax=Pseudenhygromyxa sp. WMMC2535 TaxID=2712867 RepID=UPI0015545D6E|nr:hypothetical protein [Pseudenhygromyxa sp. WMMC2535]NVB40843.1 hypothetical protein [Pseudenhygromyxa sp. WMMC2535]